MTSGWWTKRGFNRRKTCTKTSVFGSPDENLTLNEYRAFLNRVWSGVKRGLVPGGRACINIANLGRKPYIPLHAFIVEDMLDLGFLLRGEIIWNKASSDSPSTAWGSWLSAKNPTLRDIHEYILVFSNGMFRRENPERRSTISKEEFLEFTKSIWTFLLAEKRARDFLIKFKSQKLFDFR